MELSLSNLKDLDFICELALCELEQRGCPDLTWAQRIKEYRRLFAEAHSQRELIQSGMGTQKGWEILELASQIKPLLAGKGSVVQSGVLAELLSIWLAGHRVVGGDPQETALVRANLLAEHCDLVRQLVPVNERIIDKV